MKERTKHGLISEQNMNARVQANRNVYSDVYNRLLRGNTPQTCKINTHIPHLTIERQHVNTHVHMLTHSVIIKVAASPGFGQTEFVFRVHVSAGGSSQIRAGSSLQPKLQEKPIIRSLQEIRAADPGRLLTPP